MLEVSTISFLLGLAVGFYACIIANKFIDKNLK